MREEIGYCRQKAAECAARAQEAADKDTRELFSDFGIHGSEAIRILGPAAPDQSPKRRPSFAPELSARDWRERPNAARTDTTAEWLGAA